MNGGASLSVSAPSRHANPFATCWTRPGALAFRFSENQSAKQLVSNLAVSEWRGAIVGPHGSGKSTLLETLKPALADAGRVIRMISLHNAQRWLPANWWRESITNPSSGGSRRLLIIDGYEQLARLERLRLWRHCGRTRAGILVTSHRPVRIPTLIQLSPDRFLVEQLVAELCAQVSTAVTAADVAASHACHGSNVREILFDLYDRHERARRRANDLTANS
jgi:energy-coupling factor transporter ATP-binding protein EcfA2